MEIEVPSQQQMLQDLLVQATQRRPYIHALAVVSPGGQLLAAVLPQEVEAESVAAMAAPAALLGRRIALEQLEGDMRQVYVEGEGGYVILRAVGKKAILLIVAAADANLALVLHDVLQLEGHAAEIIGVTAEETSAWTEAAPAIERLRRLVSESGDEEAVAQHLDDLRHKLDSLDLGYFPERVAAVRERLEIAQVRQESGYIEEIEADLLALERDVVGQIEQPAVGIAPAAVPVVAPAARQPQPLVAGKAQADKESVDTRGSFLRRALRWLASMIASED
jgi:predicted regulator of Ras-like GTPase activity (Roadblock/LC7/MglB family)